METETLGARIQVSNASSIRVPLKERSYVHIVDSLSAIGFALGRVAERSSTAGRRAAVNSFAGSWFRCNIA